MSILDPNSLPYVIDWSAWATLAVGIAAVVGAGWIGLRQAGITARQAQIMEKQTAIAAQQISIEQTRLRAELYDRRTEVYAGIEQYLVEAMAGEGSVSNETRSGLFKAIGVAPFLLGDDVAGIGRDIHKAATLLRWDVRRLDKASEGDDADRSAVIGRIEAHEDRLTWLNERLVQTMDRYMRLSDANAVLSSQDAETN